MKKPFNKRFRLTVAQRHAWTGFLFMLPFILGFLFFFLTPVAQSVQFAFSDVKVGVDGYETGFVGFRNFKYVFTYDVDFSTNLFISLRELAWQVPTIIVASLFVALIIKSDFRGRTMVRGIFFIPVIVTSGVVVNVLRGDAAASAILTGGDVTGGASQSGALQSLLVQSGLNQNMVEFFTLISDNLFNILWKTGIQMIIFLAGLQSISPSLYEASAIEGATAWENFWKITVPMLGPIMLVNFIYTIVDSFTDAGNLVMKQVVGNVNLLRLGWASAMAWSYFVLIGILLLCIFLISTRFSGDKAAGRKRNA